MKLTIHTDGGSLKNPGKAASAYLVHDEKGTLIKKDGHPIGIASNNVAEYTALIRALSWVLEESSKDKIELVTVIADSELMIRQTNGVYKVKHPDIRALHTKVKELERDIPCPIIYTHVLREKNTEADALVKEALSS